VEIEFSQHALKRMAHRHLSKANIDFILAYGMAYPKAGAMFYFLRMQDIPADDPLAEKWQKLAGTAVVLTKDQRLVLTTWRNARDGLRRIKRKPDYDARPAKNRSFPCP
jgi:hypothetical protein